METSKSVEQKMNGGVDWNEISEKSFGGTELLCRRLEESLPKDLLNECQIIPSRVRELDETKVRILWEHDLWQDPETFHLRDEGWRKFHKIVFVSHWQREMFVREYQIPYSRTTVLKNAINPIDSTEKPTDKINLIYHSTPHRGLDLLYAVVENLAEEFNIHLDVYSSFEIYGWGPRDQDFKELFDKIKAHPAMTYHGFKPNDEIRTALSKAHIFPFPSTWMETSCLSMMEAMSAECACVHPDFGALPETTANWTFSYPFDEDRQRHANVFYAALKTQLETINDPGSKLNLRGAKNYADLFYRWEIRKMEWERLLRQLVGLPRGIEAPVEVFNYRSY